MVSPVFAQGFPKIPPGFPQGSKVGESLSEPFGKPLVNRGETLGKHLGIFGGTLEKPWGNLGNRGGALGKL